MKTFSLELSLSTITELINNSENPAVALQLIEGTYKEPTIPSQVFDVKKDAMLSSTSFNKWSNKVSYSYMRHRFYTEDKSDWSHNKSEKFCVKSDGSISNDSMSLDEWNVHFNIMKESIPAIEPMKDYEKLGEFVALQSELADANPIKVVD